MADRGGYTLGTGNSVPEYVPDAGCFVMTRAALEERQVASTPTLMDSWDQGTYPEKEWEALKAFGIALCETRSCGERIALRTGQMQSP